MGAIDISFLNPNMRKSSGDYGFLVDQLDIKRAELESDGKLTPGDYDYLTSEAQKLYGHPGLTPAQRSNIEVKIANFQKDKKISSSKESNDIAQLNREAKDDQAKIGLRFSNDPEKFLEAQTAVQQAKIERLSQSINALESAGDDASNHYNELTTALNDLADTQQALDDVKVGKTSGAPVSNYAAYIVTNSRGEVNDLKIQRVGAQSGYLETNGLYGGLPVYGKVNRKEYGKNVFILGNQTFSANDVVLPGPDGTLKPSVLISSDKQKNVKGGFSVAETGYTPIDLNSVRPQSAIREGSYIRGENGFIYEAQPGGTYKKYVNYDPEKLGITENDILIVPRSFEQGIMKSVTETADGAEAATLPAPVNLLPSTNSATTTPATTTPAAPAPVGRAQTGGAPTVRAPGTASGQAASESGKAKGFFAKLFGY